MKIIEFIPNFSEGRSKEIINKLINVAKSEKGVMLLDASSDVNHNRSVFTLMGSIEGIEEIAFKLAKEAKELIDLNKHKGEHPRMGSIDVMPFVPLNEATMEEVILLSKRVGKRIASELNIPVFLYEESQPNEKRRNLETIRKGEFEGMKEKMKDKDWTPDYGFSIPHETAGVVAVGARRSLVAFNVNLATSDIEIAKKIARIVRASSNGYKYCKAIGVKLDDKNMVQVSMNITNYESLPLYRVLETIRFEAKRYGVSVVSSELIGLAPAKALLDSANYYLQLEDVDFSKQVIEYRLLEK